MSRARDQRPPIPVDPYATEIVSDERCDAVLDTEAFCDAMYEWEQAHREEDRERVQNTKASVETIRRCNESERALVRAVAQGLREGA